MYKIISITLIALTCIGCSPKLNVTSLQPSKVNASFKNIRVEKFLYDDIFQADAIAEKLANKTLNDMKLFNVNSYDFDVILRGKVLQSLVDVDRFYKKDKSRCKTYFYDKNTQKTKCLNYHELPCENQTYIVKSKVDLYSKNHDLLFSNIYKKSRFKQKCYEDYFHARRDKKNINQQLAQEIALEVVDDLSPSLKNFRVQFMEKLSNEFNIEQDNFNASVKLLNDYKIDEAEFKLKNINTRLNGQSEEVLYNLALCKEVKSDFKVANYYYNQAKKVNKNEENLNLINEAILRTKFNLAQKQKALKQLNLK